MTPDELIAERAKTHGNWDVQSQLAQHLKSLIRRPNQLGAEMPPGQREALELILVKISRIVCGDSYCRDHWEDIAGYAKLGLDQIFSEPCQTVPQETWRTIIRGGI